MNRRVCIHRVFLLEGRRLVSRLFSARLLQISLVKSPNEPSPWCFLMFSWRLNRKRESCLGLLFRILLLAVVIKYGLRMKLRLTWVEGFLTQWNKFNAYVWRKKTRSLDSCWVARCQEMSLEEFFEINLHARPQFEVTHTLLSGC